MKIFFTKKFDYRWLLLFLIIFFLGILLYVALIEKKSVYTILNLYSFFGGPRTFSDLELLLCGVESMRQGLNPYEILCYETAAPFNYPTSWQVFSWLPFFNNDNRLWIGWTMIVIFLLTFFRYIGKLSLCESVCYILFLISPASVMLFELGNSDLIILNIILISLVLLPTYTLKYAVSLAALLKLFPIAGILCSFNFCYNHKWKFLLSLSIMIFPFAIYLFFFWEELIIVKQNTPTNVINYSYGLSRLRLNLMSLFNTESLIYDILFYILFSLGGVIFLILSYPKNKNLSIMQNPVGNGFLIGSGIFVLSYLFQINYEYRLMFLILTFPQLFKWIGSGFKFIYILVCLNIMVMWDESLTMFWNLFFETRSAPYYLALRGLRDFACIIMAYFYLSVILIFLFKKLIQDKFLLNLQILKTTH